jgi:Fe-S-cluster containining protein
MKVIPLFEEHAAEWEAEFHRVRSEFSDRMQCRRGCSMCCSQMFSVSALEAAVIANAVAGLPAEFQAQLRRDARAYVQTATELGLAEPAGESESLAPRTGVRLPCPALRNDACSIYTARPLICRKWGIPVYDPSKPDRLLACELNFQAGETVDAREIVTRQSALLERWVAVKEAAAGRLRAPVRTCTVAEAILAEHLVVDDE